MVGRKIIAGQSARKYRREYMRVYRSLHPESNAKFAKQWRTRYPDRKRKGLENYRRRNPRKRYAQDKIQYAVKVGKIIKPLRCESCKKKKELQGHHPNYSKPLKVKWLCRVCHRWTHRKLGWWK